MESTSCGANCPFVKSGFCNSEKECPHYLETWWVETQSQQPKLLKDCAPKRMLLQQQLLQHRLECMQQALEESRNEYVRLGGYLKSLVEASKGIVEQNKVDHEKSSDVISLCPDL